jgi:hypothetical protein
MKALILFFSILITAQVKCQNSISSNIEALKVFYLAKCISPVKKSIYYNAFNNTLEIDNWAFVPMDEVTVYYSEYENTTTKTKHNAFIDCNEGNCISADQFMSGVYVAFATKEDCYTFITLLAQVRKSIK